MIYHEHRYWSVVHGVRVARLSIADQHGAEHFAIVPVEAVRADEERIPWLKVRDGALSAIADHIETGAQGGEVCLQK